jgi:hypothetical protein
VEHVRSPVERVRIAGEQRGDACELAEALRVVVPVAAVAILVRPAVALEELRTVNEPCRHAARKRRLMHRARREVRRRGDLDERSAVRRRLQHRRIRRQEHAHVVSEPLERGGARADVGGRRA